MKPTPRAVERTIGIIADTHGLLRPEALAALAGVERILHAGDIGSPEVLAALEAIAPVLAVRGNHDKGPWAEALSSTEVLEIDGVWIYMLHNLDELDLDPGAAGFAAVIAGHSHCPDLAQRGDVLVMNPGSAGPRRFKLPIAVGKLHIGAGRVRGELINLEIM